MGIDVGSLVIEFFGNGCRVVRRHGSCPGRFEEIGIVRPRGRIAVGASSTYVFIPHGVEGRDVPEIGVQAEGVPEVGESVEVFAQGVVTTFGGRSVQSQASVAVSVVPGVGGMIDQQVVHAPLLEGEEALVGFHIAFLRWCQGRDIVPDQLVGRIAWSVLGHRYGGKDILEAPGNGEYPAFAQRGCVCRPTLAGRSSHR